MIGGFSGYHGAHALTTAAAEHPALAIPIVCVPASINNDLPGSELSIGADTALNSIVSDVDKIKESAVASHRCFVVEVMGHDCGYLALLAGLATGAERVHLPEEPMSLERAPGRPRRRCGRASPPASASACVIRSGRVDPVYRTDFVESLFAPGERRPVRRARRGPRPRPAGRRPSPFDRIQATRLASAAIERLIEGAGRRGRERHGRDARRSGGVHAARRARRPRRACGAPAARGRLVDGAASAGRSDGAR